MFLTYIFPVSKQALTPTQSLGFLAKEGDPDRFLLTTLAPADKREALWALLCFNSEIAKTRFMVTDTTLGLIRLQWWMDTLSRYFETGQVDHTHPFLPQLCAAISHYKLPMELFQQLLFAREFDLEDVSPETLEGTANYADLTGTPLLQLCLHVLGQTDYNTQARHVATAYGLTGIVRSFPWAAAQGLCLLPEDRLAEAGLTPQDTEKAIIPPAVASVLADILEEADRQAQLATSLGALPAFLNAALAIHKIYAAHIRRARYDLKILVTKPRPSFFELRLGLRLLAHKNDTMRHTEKPQ